MHLLPFFQQAIPGHPDPNATATAIKTNSRRLIIKHAACKSVELPPLGANISMIAWMRRSLARVSLLNGNYCDHFTHCRFSLIWRTDFAAG
jgi:hypothetical protein